MTDNISGSRIFQDGFATPTVNLIMFVKKDILNLTTEIKSLQSCDVKYNLLNF